MIIGNLTPNIIVTSSPFTNSWRNWNRLKAMIPSVASDPAFSKNLWSRNTVMPVAIKLEYSSM